MSSKFTQDCCGASTKQMLISNSFIPSSYSSSPCYPVWLAMGMSYVRIYIYIYVYIYHDHHQPEHLRPTCAVCIKGQSDLPKLWVSLKLSAKIIVRHQSALVSEISARFMTRSYRLISIHIGRTTRALHTARAILLTRRRYCMVTPTPCWRTAGSCCTC